MLGRPTRCRGDLEAAVAVAVSVHLDAPADDGFRLDDSASRLRRVGADWALARHPADHLLDVLNTLTEKTADIAVSALPRDQPGMRDAVEAEGVETGDATTRRGRVRHLENAATAAEHAPDAPTCRRRVTRFPCPRARTGVSARAGEGTSARCR